MSKGYIYILINPAINNCIKIGKTTREPEERLKELSSATGVPTPFILVYKKLFNDCDFAEKYIHSFLQDSGKRLNSSREFFNIPVHEAIDMVNNIYNKINNLTNENVTDDECDDINFSSTNYSETIFEEACDIYYGLDDHIQDYNEAYSLFLKAAKLNNIAAYLYLGIIHEQGEIGSTDIKQALYFYKEGTKIGNYLCYGKMAAIYSNKQYTNYYNIENSKKCWNLFFENFDKIDENEEPEYINLMKSYLDFINLNSLEIRFVEILNRYKDKIKENINKSIKYFSEYPKYKGVSMTQLNNLIDRQYILKRLIDNLPK